MNILESFKLVNRVAVVTGAGRGLGKTMASALAEAGANTVLCDIQEESAIEAAKELADSALKTSGFYIDVTDRDSVTRTTEQILNRFGKIDILVNNAGIVYKPLEQGGSVSIPMEDVPYDNWKRVIDVNVLGVFNCTQIMGRLMIAAGSGSVINISSISSIVGNIGRNNNAYCSSKGAVAMFSKQLATEWASKGIRVNAIAPGYMKSALGAPLDDPNLKDLLPRMTPMVRPGFPEDLKGAVVFLASDASAYITGQTIVVDGGYTSL